MTFPRLSTFKDRESSDLITLAMARCRPVWELLAQEQEWARAQEQRE